LTVRKKERKVYLKQEMKNEEVRKRGKFILLEASFSIIKRTFGNFSALSRETLQMERRFFPAPIFASSHAVRNIMRQSTPAAGVL